MEHSHKHNHGSAGINANRLLLATFLNLLISAVEFAGGLFSNSLSLLSDALHNLGDTFATFIAYIASRYSRKKNTVKATFGHKRIEILAALLNAVLLGVLSVLLFKEAWGRLTNPQPINTSVMLIVAAIGMVANVAALVILKKDAGKSINVRAAYLHLISDSLSSVVVIIGGLLIRFYNIYWVDPVITFIIGLYILKETYAIIKETINILMQNTPVGLNPVEIQKEVEKIRFVKNMHHLHLWNLTDQEIFLEAHIDITNDLLLSEADKVRDEIIKSLHNNFGIKHVTLQFEYRVEDKKDLIH